jgi:pseudaminic acid synthase
MKIKIKNSLEIDTNKRPLIIAEISGNHNGNKSLFLKHIEAASKNGADLVKIQTYEPEDITLNIKNSSFKIKDGTWKNNYLWDLYKKAKTPYEWHFDAFKLAKKKGINLFSTPFSEKGVNFLEKLNVPIYKISSFEITDLKLVKAIAKTKKPVIISTGMANLNEIKRCVETIKKFHNKVVILHCISGYPTPITDSNLETINLIKKKFNTKFVGLSDHTDGIETSLAATMLNVCVIEKHFIINKKIKTSDQKFSIDIKDLKELKKKVVDFYSMKGKADFKLKKSEKESLKLRRSIYSITDIKKNEKFNYKNISTYRPMIGLCASKFDFVIGKKSKIDIKKFSPIFKRMLK